MISPELLKRYPFFGSFTENQLKAIAHIANEKTIPEGETLLEECEPADILYILIDGGVELFYKSEEEFHPKTSREFSVGEVNPGEIFAVSSLIEPYVLNATARILSPTKIIEIDAVALRELLAEDHEMGYKAMIELTKVLMDRLINTRVQLAAAWASFG